MMTTFYTTAGTLRVQRDHCGNLRPLILHEGREHMLSFEELSLWALSVFKIAEMDSARKPFYDFLYDRRHVPEADFESTRDRLLRRGLLVCGSGDESPDALFALLSPLYVYAPQTTHCRFIRQLIYLALRGALSLSQVMTVARTAFRQKSKTERELLRLVRRPGRLTVAELICRYSGMPYEESNLLDQAYQAPCCLELLATLCRMYENKIILLSDEKEILI